MAFLKILLIQPPVQDFYETDIRLQPLGLCYLKASILEYFPEFEVRVMDFHSGAKRRTIPVPKCLKYLKPYYENPDKSPFSTFYHYYHFGASFDEISRIVASENPDIVGISSLFTPYYQEVIKTAEAIKNRIDVPVILGGAHISAKPLQMLKYDCVDFVIQGEGERPMIEFLDCWIKGKDFSQIANLGYKKKGSLFLNEKRPNHKFESIPLPDLSDFKIDDYLYEKKPLTFITATRGCVYNCSFCSVHATFDQKFQKRSVESIYDEILLRYHQGYRIFDFEDDNLTFDKKFIITLCKKLSDRFTSNEIELLAMNGVFYKHLDGEILIEMKKAGFSHLNLSLVSSGTTTKVDYNRPHDLDNYLQVVSEAYSLGFKVVSYQIIGLPFDTLENMIQTLVIHARLPVLIGASMFYLPPGSPISKNFSDPTEDDLFKARLTAMDIESDQFQRHDIYTLFISIRIINFIKGLSFLEDVANFETSMNIKTLDTRTKLGLHILERLFNEGVLYGFNGKTYNKKSQFNPVLFKKIWSSLEFLKTQNDQTVLIRKEV